MSTHMKGSRGFARAALLWTLLILGICAAAFLYFFEYYSEEVDRGFGTEARRNPYLAAEKFLDRIGIPHRQADNIAVLPALNDNDVLFLANSNLIYNEQRLWELLEWVERGGQAIVVSNQLTTDGERNLLLDLLGLEVTHGDTDLYFNWRLREVFGDEAKTLQEKTVSELMRDHNRKLAEKSKNQKSDTAPIGDGVEAAQDAVTEDKRNPEVDPERLINLTSDGGTSYSLYFDPELLLSHAMMAQGDEVDVQGGLLHWVTFQDPTLHTDQVLAQPGDIAGYDSDLLHHQSPLVFFEYGHGRITLMADSGLWQNRRIGEFDHGFFLAHLVGHKNLVMITHPHFLGFGELIRRYWLEFFTAGGLVLLAWIANRSRRFGPRDPEGASVRRSLLEHVRACGYFYWREDSARKQFEKVRSQLLGKILPHAPRPLTEDRQAEVGQSLAERTGLTTAEIITALWGPAPHSEEMFTACMRSLQIIEDAL
ncbi:MULTISPECIES: DUF4350 domain-containing protein [Microbulbifer]|uniref:DUF4350 domain-containing protein n=1 Tax=Microbulbifer TaxID=48073 RepID=UPI001CD1B0CD|nr:DUF4350 domain-containing protein [Microbulbifer agarilyticus]MCA0899933.1 DUF4350 domain-containing protein [Microbulbifer agarilyticus]